MKKILASLLLIGYSHLLFAQGTDVKKGNMSSPATDFLTIQIGNEFWLNKPDSLKRKDYSPSIGVFLNKEFPMKNKNMAVSLGAGMTYSNSFFNYQKFNLSDTNTAITFYTDSTFSKFKMSYQYFEIPLELRYYQNPLNKNKGFKAALGFKAGNFLNFYSKEVAVNYGHAIKEKLTEKRFLQTWRFALTGRVGWGNYSLFANYQINSLFKFNYGPQVQPLNVGICISGL